MSRYLVGKIDLSQIECRVLNTVAGQWDVVEKFRQKKDIYSELASEFYGFPVDKSMSGRTRNRKAAGTFVWLWGRRTDYCAYGTGRHLRASRVPH